MNLEGKVIGNRYEIIEKIGNGGMATVYKARCNILNRYVAVKVLKEEYTTDEEFIKRFNSEAQSAASLSHPNIVSIYDVGQEYNIYYIVMELVQGKTLKQIISEEGSLPWKWSINIAIQIASALEAAHKNNIVHRDIKPHNIIITEDGIAKVADFGIAKAVSNSTITAFGTTIGSVHYFSPEHARGGYTDAKSDLYSLGVVLYEMVTGKVPFDADTPVSVALKHMQEKPIEPMKINAKVPFAVNQIIMKAMQKDPGLRYASATEMLKDLTMALKNPEGSFVQEDFEGTKVIPTISDEMLNNRKSKKKKNRLQEFFEKHPKLKVAIIPITFILIFLIVLFVTLGIMNLTSAKSVEIPNLVGISIQEAEARLKELKLTDQIEEVYSNDYTAGVVMSQDPKYVSNYTVLEGSTVRLVVSKGPEKVTMIKVTGMTYEAAETALKKLNLNVEKVEEKSTKVESGIVITQEITEGTALSAGDTVKLHVSIGTGATKVVVTSVVGVASEKAKTTLTTAGLEVNIEEEEDTTKSDGVVLRQSITAGTTVDEGTSITLTVNKLSQIKQGVVNINLKSVTGYKSTDSSGNYVAPKNVEVKVNVISEGTEDTVYKQTVSEDTDNINVTVEGKGTITVKVYVDDSRVCYSTLDLDSSNTVLTVK